MPGPSKRLAEALDALRTLQEGGGRVFRSQEFSRSHREILTRNGFLQSVMKGWFFSSDPATDAGDTTPWFAAFWEFLTLYARDRFDEEWYLSPEQSLLLRGANTTVPRQVVLHSPRGTNNNICLPFGTSLYDLRSGKLPPEEDIETLNGMRRFSPEAALVKVPESFFQRYPVEAQVVLASIQDPSQLLRRLLEGGHSTVAGRLAGAFRRIGGAEVAEELLSTMSGAGHDVREEDPFSRQTKPAILDAPTAPIVTRLRVLWNQMRDGVLETFPEAPGRPENTEAYLNRVEEVYASDAYHSLSIEGYRVSPELVDRVRSGEWDPENDSVHGRDRDALAARGYWQAFQSVKGTVAKVLAGEDPATLLRGAHREWYRELFQPFVATGLLPPSALAGYRSDVVYIRGSRHVPPQPKAVREAMPAFFDLLGGETEPSVQAVLGHWMLGYIHPFPDGNGRLARFLMNTLLASGGYPWTVIRLDDRSAYMSALEEASVKADIRSFSRFLVGVVESARSP